MTGRTVSSVLTYMWSARVGREAQKTEGARAEKFPKFIKI